jgi:hypothetical protein
MVRGKQVDDQQVGEQVYEWVEDYVKNWAEAERKLINSWLVASESFNNATFRGTAGGISVLTEWQRQYTGWLRLSSGLRPLGIIETLSSRAEKVLRAWQDASKQVLEVQENLTARLSEEAAEATHDMVATGEKAVEEEKRAAKKVASAS